MRTLLSVLMGFALVVVVQAAEEKKEDKKDDKEVTLKGTITCAKCDLGESDSCHTVIKVKEGGKDTVYYFDDASSKKHHGKICKTPTEGEVTGTVSSRAGKHWVKVRSVKFD